MLTRKKVRGEIIVTGKRFSKFPLRRTMEIRQFTDPILTTSSRKNDDLYETLKSILTEVRHI